MPEDGDYRWRDPISERDYVLPPAGLTTARIHGNAGEIKVNEESFFRRNMGTIIIASVGCGSMACISICTITTAALLYLK